MAPTNPLKEYIKDLKVEGIKLQLQLCTPYTQIQHHDILGNFNFNELDNGIVIKILRGAITKMEMASSYEELFDLFKEWEKERVRLQYQGYFGSPQRKTEAWIYVLLKRILKRRHKFLYKKIFGR